MPMHRPIFLSLVVCYLSLTLMGCGFHLRGAGSTTLPESLSRLRVVVQDSRLANDPLLLTVRNALQSDPKVVITTEADAPLLALFGERTDTQVLSVSASGRASGYTLKYELGYRVTDARGASIVPDQTVRLLRDYTFDPVNILAKEQEEAELKRNMQREAIQHILRRLARYVPESKQPDASQR